MCWHWQEQTISGKRSSLQVNEKSTCQLCKVTAREWSLRLLIYLFLISDIDQHSNKHVKRHKTSRLVPQRRSPINGQIQSFYCLLLSIKSLTNDGLIDASLHGTLRAAFWNTDRFATANARITSNLTVKDDKVSSMFDRRNKIIDILLNQVFYLLDEKN